MTARWTAIVVAVLGSYVLKLAGVSLPERLLRHRRVQRTANLLPVAMLAALVSVELVGGTRRYAVDWHTLAGVAAAAIALRFRQGFLVVYLVAITVTALLRLLA
jgi:branched-subunit amino acid transport protein